MAGEGEGSCSEVSCLKLFGTGKGGHLGRLGVGLGTLRVEGGAGGLELIPGTVWEGVGSCVVGQGLLLRRWEGGKSGA